MLNLLAKDFKLMFPEGNDRKKNLPSLVLSGLLLAVFIWLEVYIFQSTLIKIKAYEGAPLALLTLFLFVISILMCLIATGEARKLFFNKLDMEQLSAFPIDPADLIASKLLFLFVSEYFTGMLFAYPVLLAYGIVFVKPPFYYFVTVFYPLLMSVAEIGLALILVYPYHLLAEYLRKHLLLQLAAALLVIGGIAFLYSKVLSVFIQLVASDSLDSLFTTENLAALKTLKSRLIPVTFLVDVYLNSAFRQFIPFLTMSFGVLILGLVISIYAYNAFRTISIPEKSQRIKTCKRLYKPERALIDKELQILFKDSDYLFSYIGLLAVEPYLAYLVVSAINTIFTNGVMAYYVTVMPSFIPLLDILLIMFFSVIIAQGADSFIAEEGGNLRLMKTIPVKPLKQLFIKVMVPYSLSMLSLLITLIVLIANKTIAWPVFLFGFLITALFLLTYDLISLYEELKAGMRKRERIFSSLYSYLLPLVSFAVSIVSSYFKADLIWVLLVCLAAVVLLGLPFTVRFRTRTVSLFNQAEATG
jgi:hypothetical protein